MEHQTVYHASSSQGLTHLIPRESTAGDGNQLRRR